MEIDKVCKPCTDKQHKEYAPQARNDIKQFIFFDIFFQAVKDIGAQHRERE